MFTTWLLTKYFKQETDVHLHLGNAPVEGGLLVSIPTRQFWKKEKMFRKIIALLTRKWKPDGKAVLAAAGEILAVEVFGSTDDYADKLYKNMVWYFDRQWKVEHLTEADQKKVDGLSGMTILTRIRMGAKFIPLLGLKLGIKVPDICLLTHPMLVKIPIISFQFYLDIDARFTFNSIRKANHPHADELVAFIYELLFIQQKIALSLHELLLGIDYVDREKKDAALTNAEIDAIMKIDQSFTYLKASVEKTILLLGHIFEISGLDGLARHKQKLNKLLPAIPEKVRKNFYYELIVNFISAENLDELNSYRSGILHKRGIADLQPHNYFASDRGTIPLKRIFNILHEQHTINTTVLLSTLAILTDDLVERDKPDINMTELLFETNDEFRESITKEYEEKQGNPADDKV